MKLKVLCKKCNKDLNNSINEVFENYQVGYVECKNCKTKTERYISESDLLLYFSASATIYTLAVITIDYFFYLDKFIPIIAVFGLIAFLFIGLYFFIKIVSQYIFYAAPFKKSWMNEQIEEDGPAIKKRLKFQFILFLLVALMFGSQPQYIEYALLLLSLFIALMVIKLYLSLRNEKHYISNHSKKV